MAQGKPALFAELAKRNPGPSTVRFDGADWIEFACNRTRQRWEEIGFGACG